jgi:succinate-semialdehyde dehydrogenase/glutarate-semialdehyde dehydrogenase
MLIDGEWISTAGRTAVAVVNPATEEIIDTVPAATPGDLDRALAAADRAFGSWRETDAWSRSRIVRDCARLMRERADWIAEVLTDEQGKPLPEARAEVLATADQFDWCADEARRLYGRTVDGHSRAQRLLVLRQPVGPVAAFSPWNFPCLLPGRKIAPAIAAGCSIIVKPAIEAPRTCFAMAQACVDAGVPAGVLNVVTGKSSTISEHLIRSPVIRKVSLTGSVPVGKQILRLCAEEIKAVTMELGGHSPVLVFADADIERAAELTARGKFRNNGQVCIAASRFYVQEAAASRFIRRFVEVTKSLRLGPGREPGVDVGPLANQRRLEATTGLVEDAVAKGATLLTGGGRVPHCARGFFFQPTVLTGVTDAMQILHDEPFCPVAPITTFTTLEDGLAKASATPFGLAAYVFTRDTRTMFLAAEGIEAGMVGVNHLVIATAEAPFGGIKQSGFGREGGTEGMDAYSVAKYLNIMLEG